MKSALRWAGQNGALVVIAGVVLGLAFPMLSDLARPYLAVAIFIFTFGSFLKFDAKSIGGEVANVKRNALMILWATFGVPLVIFLIIIIARPGPELAQGLLFWALVPASPACVAFAAILRLNIPIALLATVVGTAASPFYIRCLLRCSAAGRLDIDPIATCMELVLLIGGAFVASVAAKRRAGPFIRANPEAMTWTLPAFTSSPGMGSMRGMQAHSPAQPATSELVFRASGFYACCFSASRWIAGTAPRPWRYGRTAALTAGLISGTRTITLAWVVLGDKVLPLADLFLATGMVAKYTARRAGRTGCWRASSPQTAPWRAPPRDAPTHRLGRTSPLRSLQSGETDCCVDVFRPAARWNPVQPEASAASLPPPRRRALRHVRQERAQSLRHGEMRDGGVSFLPHAGKMPGELLAALAAAENEDVEMFKSRASAASFMLEEHRRRAHLATMGQRRCVRGLLGSGRKADDISAAAGSNEQHRSKSD